MTSRKFQNFVGYRLGCFVTNDVVSYEVLDIEDLLQSSDSWPMGVCSTVGIESSATYIWHS
ncbi:hypothetical protein T01_11309 [Trichinella spiralis]|uniref:Uncharacterized protein n=1 Tax=Trichinella spiralis TaxID=6334 RepID=A0A0V1C2B6_TRISP|nr:hypothetical protein T01_11309 [Trichinella spiralis]